MIGAHANDLQGFAGGLAAAGNCVDQKRISGWPSKREKGEYQYCTSVHGPLNLNKRNPSLALGRTSALGSLFLLWPLRILSVSVAAPLGFLGRKRRERARPTTRPTRQDSDSSTHIQHNSLLFAFGCSHHCARRCCIVLSLGRHTVLQPIRPKPHSLSCRFHVHSTRFHSSRLVAIVAIVRYSDIQHSICHSLP